MLFQKMIKDSKSKYRFGHILRQLWKGQSLARIMMNTALAEEKISGQVIDIGGGRNPDYFKYFQHDESTTTIKALDWSISNIDFEKDALPCQDNSIDNIIACNILEHLFQYQFLLKEIHRILKPQSGQVVGFVPFWVGYHADPHDYFRYTGECLDRIFQEGGFRSIRIKLIGSSPILANFNTLVLSIPEFLRPIMFIPYFILDKIFVYLRPNSTRRNPLGYIFTMRK